jgi:membrane protease subunit HflC
MNKSIPVMIVFVVVALILNASMFVIKETDRAVMLRFGRLTQSDIQPGLHFKMPMADVVKVFDARILTMDAPPESFFTAQKKRLIVDAFAKWRIADVDTFYKATGGVESVAQNRLAQRVNDGLRNEFGTRTLNEVVSGQRDKLLEILKEDLNKTVNETLGIEIIDVRVKRIDLPSEVSEQVYRRMTAEREKEARELRSKGKEGAEKIRASADRERTILAATAYAESERIRGEGDAQAAATYANAFNQDPEFYAFIRSLNAYKTSFSGGNDILLVDPEGDFFKYLNDSKAGQ